MRKVLFQIAVTAVFAVCSSSVMACPQCRAQVRSGIYNNHFGDNILLLTLPVFILALIGIGLFHADKLKRTNLR